MARCFEEIRDKRKGNGKSLQRGGRGGFAEGAEEERATATVAEAILRRTSL
jgi:hypothetical protein